jgi:hypothetical protein
LVLFKISSSSIALSTSSLQYLPTVAGTICRLEWTCSESNVGEAQANGTT